MADAGQKPSRSPHIPKHTRLYYYSELQKLPSWTCLGPKCRGSEQDRVAPSPGPEGRARGRPRRRRWGGEAEAGRECCSGCWAGLAGSLEAVEDLALHAVLDLAPAQHELQDLVDGVLWVFLRTQGRMQEPASRGAPRTPTNPPPHTRNFPSHPVSFDHEGSHFLTACHTPGTVPSLRKHNSLHRHNCRCGWHCNHPHFTAEETEAEKLRHLLSHTVAKWST